MRGWMLAALVATVALAGCGKASDYQDSGGGPNGVASLGLSSDSNSVPSAGTQSATITATALDGNNAAVQGAAVTFSASAGKLSVASQDTDASGQAQVTFTASPSSPSNQVATVTAKTGGLSRQIPIQITGTTLEVSPDRTDLPDDGSQIANVVLTLKDSGS
ncbi:MAG TPA: Ig-like domain-containing protein, partial [Gammaproteobacteria bacterium]|nr:Ig-like domain-containing protein [Gammaproteobacteria bacterium]